MKMITVHSAIVVIGLTACAWFSLESFFVDMCHMESDHLSEIIQSNEICPFIKANYGLKGNN